MTGPTLQEQARALGDPTRHAIFRHIAACGHPVGIAELNERFPLNHNAIRQHLAKLVGAGLVVEAKSPASGRGRPRLVYEVDPAMEGRWDTTGPYERLSRLLVEVVRTGRTARDVGRGAAELFRGRPASGDAVADIGAAMARHGFDPEVRPAPGGADVVLQRCPFAAAALEGRSTVCALHLGIAEGLVEGTAATVTELVADDPRRAGCRLRVRSTPDGPVDAAGPATLTLHRKGGVL
ncbi:MAG TPA: helix-turn-helix domain-containing protein [Acidimicrobiales bacterium]|nr:helix-turn-helix domain-containing protein [Acidimicrobiales bacterium]